MDQAEFRRLWEQASADRLNGNWTEAIEVYSRMLELSPSCSMVYVERGLLDLQLGNRAHAKEDFGRAIELDSEYGRAYYGRGWVRHLEGDYEGELEDARRGLQLDPGHADLYYLRMGSAYQGQGQYEQAIHAYTRAVQSASGERDEIRATLYSRGKCYLETGQYEAALEDFDESLQLDPDWGWSFAARALTHLEMGDFERAIADSDRAIRFQPDYLVSFITRGLACKALGLDQHARRNFQYVLRTTQDSDQRRLAARHLHALSTGARPGK